MTNEAKLKSLTNLRGGLKSQITRFKKYISDFQPNKLDELKIRLERIENVWDEFNNVQLEIQMIDESDAQAHQMIEFENSFFEIVTQAKTLIRQHSIIVDPPVNLINNPGHSNTPISERSNAISHNIRFPTLNLPTFKGDYSEFMSFHDAFRSLVHENKELSNIQKFYYLQGCLKGDAAYITDNLKATDSNYATAWTLLKERYEIKRIIINSHFKSMFDLPSIAKESSSALRNVLDTFLKNIRSLENIGEKTENWDSFLIYLISSKLDFVTKREWESTVKSNTLPTLKELTSFLSDRCQILESIKPELNNINKANTKYTNQRSSDNKFRTTSNIATNKKHSCEFCKGPHYIYYCDKFKALAPKARYEQIKKFRMCTICLRTNHITSECKSTFKCIICNKTHNTLLHFEDRIDPSTQTSSSLEISSNHCRQHKDQTTVLLSTAIIIMFDYENTPIKVRALLDSGSQSNFMTASLLEKLKLPFNNVNLPVIGINQSPTIIKRKTQAKFKSNYNNYSSKLSFLILNQITDNIPLQTIPFHNFDLPDDIKLADPDFNISQNIDVLLGSSIFLELLCIGQIKLGANRPIIQKSMLGWIIAGPMTFCNKTKPSNCLMSAIDNNLMHQQLEKFWLVEEEPLSSKLLTKEESQCEQNFVDNYQRDKDGRFTVSLPVRNHYQELGDTEKIAINRFLNVEKKLQQNPQLQKYYVDFMTEYELLGHMSKIDDNEIYKSDVRYYLPHHGILKESSTTTKYRVVFDGSAKSVKGNSLNDFLLVGPQIQDEFFSIILRFRKHKYVMTADIEKMYRQVNITKSQRDLQRVIWRDNPKKPLNHYHLNTVTYGTTSASFLAIRSLQQAALDEIHNFPQACKIICTDFYVDDLITGTNSIQEAHNLKADISLVLKKAGFVLRKWLSNKPSIISDSNNGDEQLYNISNNEIVKTLGVSWNPKSDKLQYATNIEPHSKGVTKRAILSIISQIFDPLGLLGPIIINAKIILQQVWRHKLDWDESVPLSVHTQWLKLYEQIKNINTISVPRLVMHPDYATIELHGFCDASLLAYGACIYIKSISKTGEIYCNLLCAKSRVAPLKTINLPRLELCGALLLAKLTSKALNSLKIDSEFASINYWCDSAITLAWLNAEPSTWKTFVCNRVSKIQTLTERGIWRHVISSENPADLISRGTDLNSLKESCLWFHGPIFLRENLPNNINNNCQNNDTNIEIPEKKNATLIHIVISDFNLIDRYSSYHKLIYVTSFILRFAHNCRIRNDKILGNLKISEIQYTTEILIKLVQIQAFSSEISVLSKGQELNRKNKLISLNPFIDASGLLRVGGRLHKSKLKYDQKHQILLPNNHKFTKLLIDQEHKKLLHAGCQAVLYSLRNKYWIINGRNTVRYLIRKCVVCFRAKPIDEKYLMGQIPASRLTPARPFTDCGVDLAGPFLIKDGITRSRKIVKTYFCLFICFSTKAVHIELLGDLSRDCFMNGLKRFIARRGRMQNIWSDNAGNFAGTQKELQKIYNNIAEFIASNQFSKYLLENQINWHFIPPRSPHFGGIWESNIKQVKHHLKRILNNVSLHFESFSTILTQVESILNSRPLCPLSSDPNDLTPLTPGHFLIGAPMTSLPQENVVETSSNRLTKYHQLQQMVQHFWRRYSIEYIGNLQQRSKWNSSTTQELYPGTMVLLKEENFAPNDWPLGRIVATHPGEDNVIRVVSVKTKNGVLKRATKKICVLPIKPSSSKATTERDQENESS